MAKLNSKPLRIDPKFEQDMKAIARIRLDKGLAKFNVRDLSPREMTRLLRNTNGYKLSLQELKTKPRKEDIKW